MTTTTVTRIGLWSSSLLKTQCGISQKIESFLKSLVYLIEKKIPFQTNVFLALVSTQCPKNNCIFDSEQRSKSGLKNYLVVVVVVVVQYFLN